MVGRKEAPSGFCSKAKRKHFGAVAPGGDCGTSEASRELDQRWAAARLRVPPGSASKALPDRGLKHVPWTSKGIKGREGRATRAQLFCSCHPSSQLFCFWLLASLGSKMLGGLGRATTGKSPLGTGHIQKHNVIGRSRKRVGGEGRETRGGSKGRKAAIASPKPGTRATRNATPQYFFLVTQALGDPRYRTHSRTRGEQEVVEGSNPDSSQQAVPEELPTPQPRPRSPEGSWRERASRRPASSPACGSDDPFLLNSSPSPHPGSREEGRLPLASPASLSRRKGCSKQREESEQGAAGSGEEGVSWGPEAGREPGDVLHGQSGDEEEAAVGEGEVEGRLGDKWVKEGQGC